MFVKFNILDFKSQKNSLKPDYNKKNVSNPNITEWSPVAYRDFNVNFGERLFRSPENFYEQSFNIEGMPKTLHDYIYNPKEHNFRKTIPPAQAMKEVFGDIKYADTLEEVKELYPDEPLFANLHSASSRKARTGVLAEIALTQEDSDYDDRSLFKNGDNDLGMYLIKKIYIEGKTLKEINKDFKRDISVVYKGLSNLQYSDINAFGIKFPKGAFWKSFIATREDFPYVFIPRKEVEVRQKAIEPPKRTEVIVQKRPRKKLSDVERRALSDYMMDLWKNLTPEERERRRHRIKLGQENSFYFRFQSPIMTIAADAVNLSDRMSDYMKEVYGDDEYMLNFTNPTDRQKKIMKDFWEQNPELKVKFGEAISDAISEFDTCFGADGENFDFEFLLNLANQIKEDNIAKAKVRAKAREDAIAAFTEPEKKEENIPVSAPKVSLEDEKEPLTLGGEVLDLNNPVHQRKIMEELKKSFRRVLDNELLFTPSAYAKKCSEYYVNHPLINERFMISTLSRGQKEVPEGVMSVAETNKISLKVLNDFYIKNYKLVNAASQAMADILLKDKPDLYSKIVCIDIAGIADIVSKNIKYNDAYRKAVNTKTTDYTKPLTLKEIMNVKREIIKYIRGENIVINAYPTIRAICENVQKNRDIMSLFENTITPDALSAYGSSLRASLDKNLSIQARTFSIERFLYDFCTVNTDLAITILMSDMENSEKVLSNANPELWSLLKAKVSAFRNGNGEDFYSGINL